MASTPQLVIAISPDLTPGFFLAGSESWSPVKQSAAIAEFKDLFNLTSEGMAKMIGVQKRTVDGWLQDRPITPSYLAEVNRRLSEHYGADYVGARPGIILR